MIARPEFGRPVERLNEVPRDHAGHRPVCPCGPSLVGEGDPGMFDRHTADRPPRDMRRGPLKESWEEDVLQRILYFLKGHPNVRGDVLHKVPLLLEVLLQAHICCLQVPARHPVPIQL